MEFYVDQSDLEKHGKQPSKTYGNLDSHRCCSSWHLTSSSRRQVEPRMPPAIDTVHPIRTLEVSIQLPKTLFRVCLPTGWCQYIDQIGGNLGFQNCRLASETTTANIKRDGDLEVHGGWQKGCGTNSAKPWQLVQWIYVK